MSYTDEYVRTLEENYSKDVEKLIEERDMWKERALKSEGAMGIPDKDPRQIRHV